MGKNYRWKVRKGVRNESKDCPSKNKGGKVSNLRKERFPYVVREKQI